MCNRVNLRTSRRDLAKLFRLLMLPEIEARYNIAPTEELLVVRRQTGQPAAEYAAMRWGLLPSWAAQKDTAPALFNARAETLDKKPAFRRAFREQRCLIPVDGFYEWEAVGRKKQPYLIALRDGGPFALAGLWERCDGPSGPVESCTIVTTDSNELVRPLHDRMPAILALPDFELWLDPAIQAPEKLKALLRPYPAEQMIATPVSTYVNSSRNKGPQCVTPVPGERTLFDQG